TNLGGNLPFGVDPEVDYSLANNGGPTQTVALLPGSPCRDAGSNPTGLTTDQRGSARVWNAAIDMGAYEATPEFIVKNANDSGPSSLRQTILDANAIAGAN